MISIPPQTDSFFDHWARKTETGWRIACVVIRSHEIDWLSILSTDPRWKAVSHPAHTAVAYETQDEQAANEYNEMRAWYLYECEPSI